MIKSIYELLGIEPYAKYEVVAEKYEEVITNPNLEPTLRKQINDEARVFVGSKTKNEYDELRKTEIEQYQRECILNNHSKTDIVNSEKKLDIQDIKFKLYKNKFKNKIHGLVKGSSKKAKVITATGLVAIIALSSGGVLSSCSRVIEEPNTSSSVDGNEETTYTDKDFTQTYMFKYVVQYGETMYALKNRFEAVSISGPNGEKYDSNLPSGVTLTVITENKDIYDKYSAIYQDLKDSEEPVRYESYLVEPGDTLPEIASFYGVTCDQIRSYNSNIVGEGPNYKIQAGTTLTIPVYEYQNNHSK